LNEIALGNELLDTILLLVAFVSASLLHQLDFLRRHYLKEKQHRAQLDFITLHPWLRWYTKRADPLMKLISWARMRVILMWEEEAHDRISCQSGYGLIRGLQLIIVMDSTTAAMAVAYGYNSNGASTTTNTLYPNIIQSMRLVLLDRTYRSEVLQALKTLMSCLNSCTVYLNNLWMKLNIRNIHSTVTAWKTLYFLCFVKWKKN